MRPAEDLNHKLDAREGMGSIPWWLSLLVLGTAAVLLVTPLRGIWLSYGGRWAYILLVSALTSFGSTPLVIRLAFRFRVLDYPDGRKIHGAPTPLLGGLAIYLAFGTSILANSIFDQQDIAILVGASLLVLVGVLDDFHPLAAGVKLLSQLTAVAIVMGSGIALTLFRPSVFGDVANAILTIVWLLGITNAMNFFDGMDGLATGLSIITAGLMAIVAVQTFQPLLGWFAAAMVGSCLGFLPFNFRPRRPAAIFLGDAGSTFLGFTLAALAVKGEWAENGFVDIAAPALIFWVFIFDMTYITLARILGGKVRSFQEWIGYVGRDHLHHRLDALLGSRRKTVLLIFLLSIAIGLAAVALRNAQTLEAVLLILQAVIIAIIFSILERVGQR